MRMKNYDDLNLSRASVVQFGASRWVMSPNWTSLLKVMTIWICRRLPFFNFERLDILCPRIGFLCEKLWPLKFLESFRCSISSVSIYYFTESDIRVKCYDHSNLLRASVVQFRVSWWVRSPNRSSVWKVRSIRISGQLPLFNIVHVDMWSGWIGHLN